jgi:hypothetical protein
MWAKAIQTSACYNTQFERQKGQPDFKSPSKKRLRNVEIDLQIYLKK